MPYHMKEIESFSHQTRQAAAKQHKRSKRMTAFKRHLALGNIIDVECILAMVPLRRKDASSSMMPTTMTLCCSLRVYPSCLILNGCWHRNIINRRSPAKVKPSNFLPMRQDENHSYVVYGPWHGAHPITEACAAEYPDDAELTSLTSSISLPSLEQTDQ